MPRIQVYIDHSMLERLTKESKAIHKPISTIASNLIETALKVDDFKALNKESSSKKMTDYEVKNVEYLLRILAISGRIYRAVYSENQDENAENDVANELREIKNSVKDYLDGVTNKEQKITR